MEKLNYKTVCLLALILLAFGNVFAQRTTQNPISVMTTQISTVPEPKLRWIKIDTNAKGSDGKPYIGITLNVANYNQYEKLFVAAPDLPACGENKNASRTWLHIIDAATGKAIYGFCAFNTHHDARDFTFLVKREKMPAGIFVVLEDRAENKNYQSNCVNPLNGKECAISSSLKPQNISLWKIDAKKIPVVLNVGKPDLRIDYFYFSADNNTLTVRVRNACKTSVGESIPVSISFKNGMNMSAVDAFTATKTIDSLAGGMAKEISVDFSAFAKGKDIRGKNLIVIKLDPGDKIKESNENNNSFGISSANQNIFPEAPCEQ